MLRFARPEIVRGFVPGAVAGHADQDTYDRLYRQAFFTVDNAELAGQAVSGVLGEECVGHSGAVGGQNPGRRRAVATYRRCMELAGGPAPASRILARRTGDSAGSAGPGELSVRERGVLGVVLFGALGYRQVSAELGISASEASALLRDVLVKAAECEPGSLPHVNQERAWP